MNRFLCTLAEAVGSGRPVEVLRTGTFTDMHGKRVEVDEALLDDLVANFEAGVAEQEVPIDVQHERKEATGWLKRLWRDGDLLLAQVDWNSLGEQLVGDQVYKYVSATIDLARKVLRSISLVNFPAVKGLSPVELAEAWADFQETTLRAYLEARMHKVFVGLADELAMAGFVSADERVAMVSSIEEVIGGFGEALGEVGGRVLETPDFEPYYFQQEVETMPEINEEELREQIRASMEAELAERERVEAELREQVRAEVEAEMAERYERRQVLVRFAEEVCGAGLSTPQDEVVEFLEALDEAAQEPAMALLKAKVVEFGERGTSRGGVAGREALSADLQGHLRTWVENGESVEAWFAANPEVGDMETYDLTEFLREGNDG